MHLLVYRPRIGYTGQNDRNAQYTYMCQYIRPIYCSGINATGLIEVEVHYILIRCIVHRYMQELEFRI